ncbi:unnamed protein product [Macrosiphum euphorbiae]|uniref:Uncharacterized protein n=1 Tax=Macrosiphum euphorbiae TaxID=13131 RepID=A0AAV0VLY9_9HEMI|nr:unnamed protein product [Macrosiphum euphorbiae]
MLHCTSLWSRVGPRVSSDTHRSLPRKRQWISTGPKGLSRLMYTSSAACSRRTDSCDGAQARFNLIIYCNDKNAVGADAPEAMRIFRLGFHLIKPGAEN